MTPEEKANLKVEACKESQSVLGIGEVYEDMISMYDLYQIIDDMPEIELEEIEVPSFIGRYIQKTKANRNLKWAMQDILNDLHDDEFNAWFENDSNFEVFAKAWMYGYTEKEQLYIMPVPYTEEAYYFEINLIGVPKPAKKWEAQKFTLEEIDKYFPKIKEFSEKVEE